jgi:flagellar basal-body rod modification protein FlgD
MDVGAVAANTAQTQARQSLSGNFDTFLRLLTTQLQNQDPLEPLDSTKFTEQLVSYSQVEQQINTNANLNTLIAMTKSAAGANAVSYLGKTAVTLGPQSSLSDGAASWRYTLTADAASTVLTIKDASGRTVRTLAGDRGVGAHDFVWDGKNDAGADLPAGTYSLTATATAANGNAIATGVSGLGFIKEIDMSTPEPLLSIGSRKVSLLEVIGFKN